MLSKPQMLSLPSRKTPYPLIEIVGQIDCGKKYMSQMLASKIGGYSLNFPLLGSDTPISNLLLKTLAQCPEKLEANPHWWIHVYIANIYESKKLIENLLKEMPVITVNYINAFRVWSKCLGLNMPQFINGFTVDLPKTDRVYCLGLDSWTQPHTNMKVNLSYGLTTKFNRSILATAKQHAHLIRMSDTEDKFRHIMFNKALLSICLDLKADFGVEYNDLIKFTQSYFAPKGN